MRVVLLAGYNDTAIDIELFNSILRTFKQGKFVLNLNLILLENDYYTSNYLKDTITNFLEYDKEINPSKDKELLEQLLFHFKDGSYETKLQSISREINKLTNDTFGNTNMITFMTNFDKKLKNLIDMNEIINTNLKGCDNKDTEKFSKEDLEKIFKGENYLQKVIVSITNYVKLEEEKKTVFSLLDEGSKNLQKLKISLEIFNSSFLHKKSKYYLTIDFYWQEKIKFIENQIESFENLAKKIKFLKEFINLIHEITVSKITSKLETAKG